MIEKKDPLNIYNNLIQLYPSADITEMKDLSIGGFADVLFLNGTLLNNTSTDRNTAAEFLANQVAATGAALTPSQYMSEIDKVSAANVAAFAKQLSSSKPTLAALGDVQGIPRNQ